MIKTVTKTLAGVSILAISLVGAAHADKTVTANIEYDQAMLQTEAGAAEVLTSISRQAIQECRSVSLVSSGFHRDEVCELDLIHRAVEAIDARQLASVYAASDYYIDTPVLGLVLASNE
ncbi:MAG: UrcA family protein [Pseudomonadota bacterium]